MKAKKTTPVKQEVPVKQDEESWQEGFDEAMKRIKEILKDESICHNLTVTLLESRLPLHPVQPDQILEPKAWYLAQGNSLGPDCTAFYIYHSPSKTYTTIGAKNIHHACNKATKEFNGEWTGIGRQAPKADIWKFKTVADFNKILRRDPQVPF